MPTAQPKRYYSVKEASILLGVSTNTIYTYLKEGKLTGRRIGRGRFKIPYRELAPFVGNESAVDASQEFTQAPVEINIATKPDSLEAPVTVNTHQQLPTSSVQVNLVPQMSQETKNLEASDIAPFRSDKAFWRLFKGLIFLGLGIIYIFTGNTVFYFSGTYLEESDQILNFLLPFGLTAAGVLTLLNAQNRDGLKYFDPLIHVFSAIVFSYFAFVSLVSGEYGRFVFSGSFAILTISHLVTGFSRPGTFFKTFVKLTALISALGGIVILINPSYFPLPFLTALIAEHKGVFGFLWFGLLTVPSLYLLSPYGETSKVFSTLFFFVGSSLSLILATDLAVQSKWDISYMTYLFAVFGLFLSVWQSLNIRILKAKFLFPSLGFVWAALGILGGIFVVDSIAQDFDEKNSKVAISNLDTSIQELGSLLNSYRGIMVGFASQETISIIDSKDKEAGIQLAKELFDKTELASRAIIFDKDGIAIGVYPREILAQGTNFSTREYFSESKRSYKGTTSHVFTDIVGGKSIIMTEPVFKDNEFYGLIGLNLDLQKLSSELEKEVVEGNGVHVVDGNEIYAFGSNINDIGKRKNELAYLQIETKTNMSKGPKIYQSELPELDWKVYLVPPPENLATNASFTHILLSVFVVINSAFSVMAGIAIASRGQKTNVNEASLNSPKVPSTALSLGSA